MQEVDPLTASANSQAEQLSTRLAAAALRGSRRVAASHQNGRMLRPIIYQTAAWA